MADGFSYMTAAPADVAKHLIESKVVALSGVERRRVYSRIRSGSPATREAVKRFQDEVLKELQLLRPWVAENKLRSLLWPAVLGRWPEKAMTKEERLAAQVLGIEKSNAKRAEKKAAKELANRKWLEKELKKAVAVEKEKMASADMASVKAAIEELQTIKRMLPMSVPPSSRSWVPELSMSSTKLVPPPPTVLAAAPSPPPDRPPEVVKAELDVEMATTNLMRDILWVYENFDDEDVSLDEAPSSGAKGLWRHAHDYPVKFYGSTILKPIAAREKKERAKEAEGVVDPGGKVVDVGLADVMRLLREVEKG